MINFDVFKPTVNYSNNYMGSKYNYLDFHKYKNINPLKIHGTKGLLYSAFNNEREYDKDKILNVLFNYYKCLDVNLNRLKNNASDQMFRRFAYLSIMFKYENLFMAVCNNWEEMYNDAFFSYMTKTHLEYDESFGISYVAYFDTHFSQVLYKTFVDIETKLNNSSKYEGTYLFKNSTRALEVYRFSWMSEEEINLFSYRHSHHQYQREILPLLSHLKSSL